MKIGIDISQIAHEKTGVANYLRHLVENLIAQNSKNEYILFYASLRKSLPASRLWSEGGKILSENCPKGTAVSIRQFKIPPTLLDILWNRLHIFPIEQFIGSIDVFVTSDWTEPPVKKAKKVTILYDLIVYKYPEETHDHWNFNIKNFLISSNIVALQKRRLYWVKKESDAIICISESTKKDAIDILGIEEKKLQVIYPGI